MDSTNQQKTQILVKKGYRILAQNFGTHFPQTLSPRKTQFLLSMLSKTTFLTNWNMRKMIVFYIIQNAVANTLACCKVSFVNFISNGTSAIGTHFRQISDRQKTQILLNMLSKITFLTSYNMLEKIVFYIIQNALANYSSMF